MLTSSKSVAAQFAEFRRIREAAGGNAMHVRYPEPLRKAAVSYLRSDKVHKVLAIATELGIGEVALRRWETCFPRPRPPNGKPPVFLPVDVILSKAEVPTEKAVLGSLTLTYREITVDFGSAPDKTLLSNVLDALRSRQGGAAL